MSRAMQQCSIRLVKMITPRLAGERSTSTPKLKRNVCLLLDSLPQYFGFDCAKSRTSLEAPAGGTESYAPGCSLGAIPRAFIFR